MKRIYVLAALGLMLAIGVQAATVDVSTWPTSSGADARMVNNNTYTGTLNGTSQAYKLIIPAGATVYLEDLKIWGNSSSSCKWAGITCEGNATIILKGTNEVRGFHENYPGIYVAPGYKLTIGGTGSLKAYSNGYGAGIGGGYNIDCGNITINGGVIKTEGGYAAAGIGGGYKGTVGAIRIAGGSITAKGGQYAAAIGGGRENGTPGNLIITNDPTLVIAVAGSGAPCSIGRGLNGTEYTSCIVNGTSYASGVAQTNYRYPACGNLTDVEVSGITQTYAELTWAAPSYIDHFSVVIRTRPSGTWQTVASNYKNTGSGWVYVDGLTAGQQYELAINSYCEEGCYGVHDGIYFTTDPLPCLLPTGLTVSNIGETSAHVAWNKVGSNQTKWKIAIKKASSSSWDYVSVTTNSRDFTSLDPNTEYNVKVQAACGSVWTDWTSAVTFKTEEAACIAPKDLEIVELHPHIVALSWDPGKLSKWSVSWRKAGTGSADWTYTADTYDSYYQITDLDVQTEYDVIVQGYCESGMTYVSYLRFETPEWDGNLADVHADVTVLDGMHLYGTLDGATQPHKIYIAEYATVYLENAVIDGKGKIVGPAIECEGDAKIILGSKTTGNEIKGMKANYPAIYVPAGAELEIDGDSESWLTVTGGASAAAIGSKSYGSCGNIWIEHVNIIAQGGSYAAAIGGGDRATNGKITITNSAHVKATAGSGAPCSIGRGNDGTSGLVCVGWFNYGTEGVTETSFENPLPETGCVKPSNIQVLSTTATSATITFDHDPEQTGWYVYWKNKEDAAFYRINNYVVAHNLPVTIEGLEPSTGYDVNVRAFCGDYLGFSNMADGGVHFVTDELCPQPKNVLADEVLSNSATITWESAGADFNYQYGTTSSGIWSDIMSVQGTSVQLKDLTANTPYSFRVRQDCGSEKSNWTEIEFTSAKEPCRVPTDLVASDITKTSAVLSWTAGTETNWHLYWKKSTASSYNVEYVSGTPSFKLTNLAPETVYMVSLMAVCGEGDYSGWYDGGNDFMFATEAKCLAPSSLHASNITMTSATFTWTPNNGETNWTLDLKRTDGEGSSYMTTISGEPTFTKSDLRPGTEYEVEVRAICGEDASEDAAVIQFRTDFFVCQAPTDFTVSGITSSSALFSWTANNGESEWLLSIMSSDGSDVKVIHENPYLLEGLKPNTQYFVNIEAYCGDGYSDWWNVDDLSFYTADEQPAICTAPSNLTFSNVTENSVDLDWTPGGLEAQWFVNWKTSEDIGFIYGKSVDEHPYTLDGLEPGTTYQLFVQAFCNPEISEDSNIIEFTTLKPQAIDGVTAPQNVIRKVIRDGQLLILRDGKIFNAQGVEIK